MNNLDSNTFFNHKPTQGQCALMDDVSEVFARLWDTLNGVIPDGANKTLAYRHLEDAAMRCKKAVILDTPGLEPPKRAHS